MATKQETAKAAKLEKDALNHADGKSAGMRSLLANGYTIAQVREVFDAGYGFVYGVASRMAAAGELDLDSVRDARSAAAPAPAKAPKAAKAAPAPKAAAATKAAPRARTTAGKAAGTKAKAKA